MITIACQCGQPILFDDDVAPPLLQEKWTCKNSGGVRANGEHYLSSYILPVPSGMTVDHADRNIHNFQKANLRQATYQQNVFNRGPSKRSITGYKGVSFDSRAKKMYRAFICHNEKKMYIGSYNTAEEAAFAYNQRAKELFGEFAYLNPL